MIIHLAHVRDADFVDSIRTKLDPFPHISGHDYRSVSNFSCSAQYRYNRARDSTRCGPGLEKQIGHVACTVRFI